LRYLQAGRHSFFHLLRSLVLFPSITPSYHHTSFERGPRRTHNNVQQVSVDSSLLSWSSSDGHSSKRRNRDGFGGRMGAASSLIGAGNGTTSAIATARASFSDSVSSVAPRDRLGASPWYRLRVLRSCFRQCLYRSTVRHYG